MRIRRFQVLASDCVQDSGFALIGDSLLFSEFDSFGLFLLQYGSMDGTSNLDLFTHEPLLQCGFVSPFNSFGKLASHKRCLVVWTVVLHASRKRTGSEVWTNKLTERVNRESLTKCETDKRNDRMSNEGTFERSKVNMRDTAAKVAGKPDEDELRLTHWKHNELWLSSTPARQTCQASAWLLGFGI